MSESDSKPSHEPTSTQVPSVRIAQDAPVVYADAIASHAWTPNVSKFYLVRFDSDARARASNTETFVAQIVMPNNGFVNMFTFMEHRLKLMIEGGILSESDLEKSRNVWRKEAETPDASR